ncbi:MAG: Rpn family recombination-promoting nuclease/putative transposase [Dysgonamonadaceae bacterium]|jgi:predicted transposase/invertase (TIGR01784 family)|nr:Rpn family recombination-promoting nuclease/putative transposase [Dysgonamonadaceae bacterium]
MKKEVYINPLTDFGFKRIFGEERNKALLIDFLNEIIEEERKIVDIEYQPTEQTGIWDKGRKAVFDIFCKNDRDEFFIVEMQKVRQDFFMERSLFYSSFAIQKQAFKGAWDFNLKAVYTVAVLDFKLFEKEADNLDFCVERIHLVRERTGEKYSNKLNLIFIELPKFQKMLHELATNFERWLYCLKNLPELESQPEEVKGAIFDELFQEARINQLTEQDMETYRKSVLEYADVQSAIRYAHKTSYTEGINTGRVEGMNLGITVGVEQGRNMEKIAIIKNLLALHIPMNDIALIVEMSPEQVKAVAAEK